MDTGKPEPTTTTPTPVLGYVGKRPLPDPTPDIKREFGSVGEVTCIESRVRRLMQNALLSHAILSMRKVMRWEKEIKEAGRMDRPGLVKELDAAKERVEEDLAALKVLAETLKDIPRCDGG